MVNIVKADLLLYSIGLYLSSVIITSAIAYFVPPSWAMCECLYNTVKQFLIAPGSLIAGAATLYYSISTIEKGISRKKAATMAILYVSSIYIILSIANAIFNG